MYEIILVYLLVILILTLVFLFTIHDKKRIRNGKYVTNRMSFLRHRFSYMSLVDNKYLQNVKYKLDLYLKKISEKNQRIKLLEDLIYGSGKRLGGITLPPLDLTNSGIFCVR